MIIPRRDTLGDCRRISKLPRTEYWGRGARGEGHVPGAVELAKEVAAWCRDVAVVWTSCALRARVRWVPGLKRVCEDARKEHEKEEEGCLEEHDRRMWYRVWSLDLRNCICRMFARRGRWNIEL